MNLPVEQHPLQPFLPSEANVLFLGSFPPKRIRWSMEFYYPNVQNDFWRIIGLIFFDEKGYFLSDKRFDEVRVKAFCREKGFAFYDTAQSVIRLKDNASDKFLEVVEPIDLTFILGQIPNCRNIVITGQKAADTLLAVLRQTTEVVEPGVGHSVAFLWEGRTIHLHRMPSSSRAYPKPLVAKAEDYLQLFRKIGLITV